MRENATNVVIFNRTAVDLASIASMHWEHSKLYVHLNGGRFLTLLGNDALTLWERYTAGGLELHTGELVGQ